MIKINEYSNFFINKNFNLPPFKPKKIKRLTKLNRNNLGHKKLTPLISVINRVLNLLLIASTKRKELVDKRA